MSPRNRFFHSAEATFTAAYRIVLDGLGGQVMVIWTNDLDSIVKLLAPIASATEIAIVLSDITGELCSRSAIAGRCNRQGFSFAKGKPKPKSKQSTAHLKPQLSISPILPPPATPGLGKKLVDHLHGECLWPSGGWPGNTPVTFCCQPIYEGYKGEMPYCEDHCLQSYQGEFWR